MDGVLDDSGHTETAVPIGDAVAFPGCTTTYEFRNLPAGNYMVKAYARDLASVIIPSVTVTASETTMQDLVFTSGGTLVGQVTDGVNGISGATVTIEENGRQAATEDPGSYTIAGINTGTYMVKVSASGYADTEAAISVTAGSTTIQDFILNATVGSISGTVKTGSGDEINGATVLAYNETDKTFDTAETVGGTFYITKLTAGEYVLAVETVDYGVVVHPSDGSRITLSPQQDITGIDIVVDTPQRPVFTVNSTVTIDGSQTLSMEFHSEPNLISEPIVAVVPGTGNGSLGILTSNPALNRFEIDYTVDASDDIVQIEISEANPIVVGNPASKTFTFEVSSNLVQTSSTNVTNAMGGKAKIMGTQDNTQIYVPPFAITGASNTQALTLTIERYGDPGDAVSGTTNTGVSAVYDFEFVEDGVSIDIDHTFTITMSFQLPEGMTLEAFEDSLEIRYFDAGDQQWKTDGISNVHINWASSTITFDINHLTKFAAFVNDTPVANNDNYTIDEDTVLNIAAPGILANDTDADGDSLTAMLDVAPTNGALTLNANGSFSYTPDVNFYGPVSFTYFANDGMANSSIVTVTITVNPINDVPLAEDDSVATDEDTPVAIDMLTNDSDVDGDTLTVASVSEPANGSAVINGNNTVTYTPNPNFYGTDNFTYTVGDGNGGTDTATVTVTVNPVNDAPVATDDDTYSTYEDTVLNIAAPGVLVNDSDVDGDLLTAVLDTPPSNGTVSLNDDGSFTYTPNRNFSGTDSFTYTASDGNSMSEPATVKITVYPSSEIMGMVWEDFNNNGEIDFNEKAIENVTIILSGTDDLGDVNLTTQTDVGGIYMFYDLRSGEYIISEVQPVGFEDGQDSLGTVNNIVTGDDSVDDLFSGVILTEPGSVAENYNFGERPLARSEVTAGQTATIGFWQNKNGQDLIKSLNGGPNSTQLGAWLAATFPNMYGVNAGANDLTGMTNAEVVDFYSNLFHRKKKDTMLLGLGGPTKMDAQVMAAAFAVYVTNSTLADTTASTFGFMVTEYGVGISTFNVGFNGDAFGVEDNSDVTILDLLLAINNRSMNGVLYDRDGDGYAIDDLEILFRTMANDVFSAINEQGDI